MILRKVSNLEPGDKIVIHDTVIEIEYLHKKVSSNQWTVQFVDAPTRTLHKDDYVEIVIL